MKVEIMESLEEASELSKDFCNLKSKFMSIFKPNNKFGLLVLLKEGNLLNCD